MSWCDILWGGIAIIVGILFVLIFVVCDPFNEINNQ